MFFISREFTFSYGHRLLDYKGKCARLHGHNGRVRVILAADQLNGNGMVLDFSHFKARIGNWIDQELDHRTVLNRNDPLATLLIQTGEPVVLLDENPTAEIFAQLIFNAIKSMELPVVSVNFWETKNCQAVFNEDLSRQTTLLQDPNT